MRNRQEMSSAPGAGTTLGQGARGARGVTLAVVPAAGEAGATLPAGDGDALLAPGAGEALPGKAGSPPEPAQYAPVSVLQSAVVQMNTSEMAPAMSGLVKLDCRASSSTVKPECERNDVGRALVTAPEQMLLVATL